MTYCLRVADEIHHTVIISAPAKFGIVFFGKALDQNALCGTNHTLTDYLRLPVDFFLQVLQSLKFNLVGSVVR